MFVRFLIGTRAGEVHEMKYADAQPLLNDGRAELAYQDKPAEVRSVPFSSPAPAPAHRIKAKSKKR